MRAFPWVGLYIYTYTRNNRNKDICMLIVAFVLLYIFFYLIYMMSTFLIAILLFNKSRPNGIDQNFYGFFAVNEFFTLLFLRTRSSIKFYPLISNSIFFVFLQYFMQASYGFTDLALYVTIWAAMCI